MSILQIYRGFPGGTIVKHLPPNTETQETWVRSWVGRSPAEATTPVFLLNPWTEETDRLQSMGSQKHQTQLRNWAHMYATDLAVAL